MYVNFSIGYYYILTTVISADMGGFIHNLFKQMEDMPLDRLITVFFVWMTASE